MIWGAVNTKNLKENIGYVILDSTYEYLKLEEVILIKSTGIVWKVDNPGRIVIPKELRRTLSIGEKDALEIFTDCRSHFIYNKLI